MAVDNTKLLSFAELVARLHLEGEVHETEQGVFEEYSPSGNDDEIDTLYDLISMAREVTGVKPATLVEICECGREPVRCAFIMEGSETHKDC